MCNCHRQNEFEYELLPEFEMDSEFEYDQLAAGTRNSRGYTKWVQRNLNRILKLKPLLTEDGIRNKRTVDNIIIFQRKNKIRATGIVDEITEKALIRLGSSKPPVHHSLPLDCRDAKEITKDFARVISEIVNKLKNEASPPVAQRIIAEIKSIVAGEGAINLLKFKVFVCSDIVSPLVVGEKIAAQVLVAERILHLSQDTWHLAAEFLGTNDISVLIRFFQTLAHEKRHATLGELTAVKASGLKNAADPMAAQQASYRVQEILVKAEEIAVAKKMNPDYKVPADEQSNFRRNWYILSRLVTSAELSRLRTLIILQLRQRYRSTRGCDSSLTLGVLKSMETGQWFRCYGGKVHNGIPAGLKICKQPC